MRYIGSNTREPAVNAADFLKSINGPTTDFANETALDQMLLAAQGVVEMASARPLSVGLFEFTAEASYFERWYFPCSPVDRLEEVAFTDSVGEWVVQDLSGFLLVRKDDEPQIKRVSGVREAAVGEEMRVRAWVGLDAQSQHVGPLRQAIILLCREWLDSGRPIEESIQAPRLSFGPLRLVRQHRYRRPFEYR